MHALAYSPRSRADLIEIGDYIARDNRAAARRLVESLIAQCKKICRAPLAYPAREELAADLRMAPLGQYVVFFRVIEDQVRIERVLHGSRDLPAVFGGSGKP